MNINEAIRNRNSTRKYTTEPVQQKILQDIIETSQWTGSFLNVQPWEFAVLGGNVMQELKDRLIQHYESGKPVEREYAIGMPLQEPYSQRAEEFRVNIDSLMFPPGTENLEQAKRDYTYSGLMVRDVPNAIVIYTEKKLFESPLHIMALGMIAQSVCLSALEYGLSTCIMGRPVETPNILRELLGIASSKIIMCVIAIGYRDETARINQLVRNRVCLDEWVHWHGFTER